ncbi:MAG: 30S ribosomal protein S9 [Endomicrobium sp.]|nr:30S ribosomal protein S9 [Endomicrobium sp.]
MNNFFCTTVGRRKNSVARVSVCDGVGKISINGKTLDDFFCGLIRHKNIVLSPISVCGILKYDFYINVRGGGITGQAGAISLGLSRAILKLNESLKSLLKKKNLLTRDSRMVERKKAGRVKARKRFQYSKR